MADPHVISGLKRKRDEIENAIAAYTKKLEAAKRDLAHVNAALRMFQVEGERLEFPAYMDTYRLFRRGEIFAICNAALTEEGPLDTRELAVRVMRAKGLDVDDHVLRQSLTFRILHVLRMHHKRGKISDAGRRKGVRVWEARDH